MGLTFGRITTILLMEKVIRGEIVTRMGALRKISDKEVEAISRLSNSPDFIIYREFLKDSLDALRESSDFILEPDLEFISKGHRQCLSELFNISDRDKIMQISKKVRNKGVDVNPLPLV